MSSKCAARERRARRCGAISCAKAHSRLRVPFGRARFAKFAGFGLRHTKGSLHPCDACVYFFSGGKWPTNIEPADALPRRQTQRPRFRFACRTFRRRAPQVAAARCGRSGVAVALPGVRNHSFGLERSWIWARCPARQHRRGPAPDQGFEFPHSPCRLGDRQVLPDPAKLAAPNPFRPIVVGKCRASQPRHDR